MDGSSLADKQRILSLQHDAKLYIPPTGLQQKWDEKPSWPTNISFHVRFMKTRKIHFFVEKFAFVTWPWSWKPNLASSISTGSNSLNKQGISSWPTRTTDWMNLAMVGPYNVLMLSTTEAVETVLTSATVSACYQVEGMINIKRYRYPV